MPRFATLFVILGLTPALEAGHDPPTRVLEAAVPPGTATAVPGEAQSGQPAAFTEASLAKASATRRLAAPPFELVVHDYLVASTATHVVEVVWDGVRHGLFTHVDGWVGPSSVSSDGEHLFLSNHKLQPDGSWQQQRRIVRLVDKKRTALPRLDCIERGGFWSGDHLITYGLNSDACCPAPGHSTPVCAWNAYGDLVARAEVHACWHAYGAEAMESHMGLLPADPDVLWLYNGDCASMADPDAPCWVYLQELDGEQRSRMVELPGARGEEGCRGAGEVKIEPGASTFSEDRWTVSPVKAG